MNLLLLVCLLRPALASSQQLSLPELLDYFHKRGDKSAFTEKAESAGFHFLAKPYGTAHDGFIYTDTSTVIFVKWNRDMLYTFKEREWFYRLEAKALQMGYQRQFRAWGVNDERTSYWKDGIEVVFIRYQFRTPKITYGLSFSESGPRRFPPSSF